MTIPYDSLEYHPASERLVKVLCSRIQTTDALFFHVMVAYFFATAAAQMRTMIQTPEGNKVPVNVFALDLAPSGFGKGRATSVLEDEVLDKFRHRYLEETFPTLAEDNLPKLSLHRAKRKGVDPDEELVRVEKEFAQTGELMYSFDSGTDAAVKQMRHKLLMAGTGSMNLQIDEVGSNLLKNLDMLDVFLELYDGKVKSKLTKNTTDNVRNEEIKGLTPTNMLLFGTPSRLLNGGKQEEEIMAMLEAGYARRCLFGYIRSNSHRTTLTPQEALQMAQQTGTDSTLKELSDRFENLADIINANKTLLMPEDTALAMYQYKLDCEQRAQEFSEHEETRKTEMESRFFKVLKLAGAYAFVDDSPAITRDHYFNAIKLAEASGEALGSLLNRDKPYVKLARYIADINREVTHADLVEDLPFYPKAQNQRNDMLNLATAWGYKNNIVLKKSYQDGIEFLRGESLKETDLSQMVVSYSDDIVTGYQDDLAPFDQLHVLTQHAGLHWVNHHLIDGYRKEENAKPGFNMVVFDVDGSINLTTAKLLLKDYKALYYTTKRHTDADNRFRIVIPTNFELKLDAKDYKEFMGNLLDWLPFEADPATGQRARKWLSHNGHYEYTDGELLDVLPFIPKTSKNEERKAHFDSQQSLDNLERWVINNIGDGNRNNQLLRYAYILVDAGFDFEDIRQKVNSLNAKIADKLSEAEIMGTIMVTVSKALTKRNSTP
ncbi:DUF3987 domain-containing protein [Larsenimonas suaedae]|uniref:DUF3987 domain-containing protein n=1 Tax=Larsenimonas suaedae TaxID=1851019 RepID=A0ABU1GZ46_9GAMM|nr:DUF3987 domain-containing protein [Larsenimonas suaedae]MCM2973799.1 DUF3987 domain-containing protein [Larsenimonas suaedae]MDR5897323.1 DUF3987 domain-containing protein [Larsenimonas suaedae]